MANGYVVKPMHHFEVWHSGWGVIGWEITGQALNWKAGNRRGERNIYVFKGKRAICRVLALETDITRAEALKFATAIMVGNFYVASFDLDKCTVNWKTED